MSISVTRDSSGKAVGLVVGLPTLTWKRIVAFRGHTSHQLVVDGEPIDWFVERACHPTQHNPWEAYEYFADGTAQSIVSLELRSGEIVRGKFKKSAWAKETVEEVYVARWTKYWTAERQLELLREFNEAEAQH